MLACGAPPPGKSKMLQNNQRDTSICFAGVEECRMVGMDKVDISGWFKGWFKKKGKMR